MVMLTRAEYVPGASDGNPLETLQLVLQPFLVVLLVPVAYAAYRTLIGSAPVALLASLLLFLSPEFLFEATRSSHAKVTWLLALTTLFVLVAASIPTLSPPLSRLGRAPLSGRVRSCEQ